MDSTANPAPLGLMGFGMTTVLNLEVVDGTLSGSGSLQARGGGGAGQKPSEPNRGGEAGGGKTRWKAHKRGVAFADLDSEPVAICDLPDNVSAAALSISISVGGMTKAIKTTPLINGPEGLEAMARAANAGYRAPGL